MKCSEQIEHQSSTTRHSKLGFSDPLPSRYFAPESPTRTSTSRKEEPWALKLDPSRCVPPASPLWHDLDTFYTLPNDAHRDAVIEEDRDRRYYRKGNNAVDAFLKTPSFVCC